MTVSPVSTAAAKWSTDVQRYLNSVKAAAETLAAYAHPQRNSFRVCIIAPAAGSPEAEWANAVETLLARPGISVTVLNVNGMSREHIAAELADADAVVALVLTPDVCLECFDALSNAKAKLLICYPHEDVGEHSYSLLSQQKHGLDFILFGRQDLDAGNGRLGVDVFVRICSRMTQRNAYEARQFNVQNTLIVLIHGILSMGTWQEGIKRTLKKEGFLVESTNAGLVHLPAFLLPFGWLRELPVDKVSRQLQTIRQDNAQSRIAILAHSFGTFITSRLFERDNGFSVERLAFCGSIAPERFQLPANRCRKIVNEVGCRDWWPALANTFTWGYGHSGTFGSHTPGVEDRWHGTLNHGGFLTKAFCEKYWIPYFADGTVVPSDDPAAPPPRWIRAITLFPPKIILWPLMVVLSVWGLWRLIGLLWRLTGL